MACVNVPELPLQLLLRGHADWRGLPVAVVDRDKPNGLIQWVNDRARAYRILPGMRYATGLALSANLRAGVVTAAAIAEAVEQLTQQLWRFSPRIEPASSEPGVFWLDASGLRFVYPSLSGWADSIGADLREAGFAAVVAVGFSRFGSYAAAKASAKHIVFESADREWAYCRRVPLDRLSLNPGVRDTLHKLGVETLGRFVDLPGGGVRKRFGVEAEALHRLAKGNGWTPLDPLPPEARIERTATLDWPEDNVERLVAQVAALLGAILSELSARYELLETLRLDLLLDDGTRLHEEISPASPTLDAVLLMRLTRLRLEGLALSSGVMALTVRGIGTGADERQLELGYHAPRRHLESANEALAAVRAAFGNQSVVRARIGDGHLPEAGYHWEPVDAVHFPKPSAAAFPPLVRRIYTPPKPLPHRDRHEPDGWMVAGFSEGPVEELIGPHLVWGGWWLREVLRAYYYVRLRSGRWLWIFHDQKRRRWYLHGEVQ